jgi:peroxiredoxin
MALMVVVLGLAAVAAVILSDRLPLPSVTPQTGHDRAPPAVSAVGLQPWFAAMGIHRPVEPAVAPDFTLVTLEGRPLALRELRGKLVMLNFWATWCAPCLHEMPSMQRLYHTFKQTEFILLAVSMDRQGAEVARSFVESLKLTFPVLLDPTLAVGRLYNVRGLPVTYLIDPDGQIIGTVIGARDWYRTEAKALVAGLLQQTTSVADRPMQSAK